MPEGWLNLEKGRINFALFFYLGHPVVGIRHCGWRVCVRARARARSIKKKGRRLNRFSGMRIDIRAPKSEWDFFFLSPFFSILPSKYLSSCKMQGTWWWAGRVKTSLNTSIKRQFFCFLCCLWKRSTVKCVWLAWWCGFLSSQAVFGLFKWTQV